MAPKTPSKKASAPKRTPKKVDPPPPAPMDVDEDDEGSSSSSSDDDDDDITSAINLAASAIKSKWVQADDSPSTATTSEGKINRGKKNALTYLVPGYTAPLRLSTSSTPNDLYIKYQPHKKQTKREKAAELENQASSSSSSSSSSSFSSSSSKPKSKPSTSFDYVAQSTKPTFAKSDTNLNPTSTVTSQTHLMKTHAKMAAVTNAGSGWFNFAPSIQTNSAQSADAAEALKKDLAVIRMRNYLDPKKFYKSSDKFGKFLQVGTVIESGSEWFSSRLTKAERRNTLLEEVMSEKKSTDYAKKQFVKIQKTKESGGKKAYTKLKEKRVKRSESRPFQGKKSFY